MQFYHFQSMTLIKLALRLKPFHNNNLRLSKVALLSLYHVPWGDLMIRRTRPQNPRRLSNSFFDTLKILCYSTIVVVWSFQFRMRTEITVLLKISDRAKNPEPTCGSVALTGDVETERLRKG
jgi:hypothetical protein